MKYAQRTERLSKLAGDKWAVHQAALARRAGGEDIIVCSIGEPEIEACPELMAKTIASLQTGRTGYLPALGEPDLRQAIADWYTLRRGRAFGPENVLCLPGTQSALYVAMSALIDPRDEVLVADPFYVTYEGVIAAQGGQIVPVPLDPDKGFDLDPCRFERAITPKSRAILLNSPHNPTGMVVRRDTIKAIGKLAQRHDLWIISDEVYEDLVFDGDFASPLEDTDLADRCIGLSSISKSHAAPGFRSGWIVGPAEFIRRTAPITSAMLFGNQPFIADATAHVLSRHNTTADQMRASYAQRAKRIAGAVQAARGINVSMPRSGMFVMLDIRETGLSSEAFAWRLLEEEGISVLPGDAFGAQGAGFVRVSLTVTDAEIDRVCRVLAEFEARVPV